MKEPKQGLMFRPRLTINLLLVLDILSIFSIVGSSIVLENREYETVAVLEPLYGMQFVPDSDFGTVSALGAEVVIWVFGHDDTPESWLAILDDAQAQGIEVIAVLVPEGWSWDSTAWQIDEQARSFVQTVAGPSALFTVYALYEPYWMGCVGCGYTTYEQQLLYYAIKAIAEVPIFSAVGNMAFCMAQGEETAFADSIYDYCGTWYYPFRTVGYKWDESLTRL